MVSAVTSRATSDADELYNMHQRRIVGPYLIGCLVQSLLFGMICNQYWTLLVRSKTQLSRQLHLFLVSLVICNTANEAATFAAVWHLIVDYISHPRQSFIFRSWASVAIICFYSLIVHMCTIFFARRCYILTGRSKLVAWLFGIGIGISLLVALMTCAMNVYVTMKGQSFVETRLFLTIALGLQAALDVTVSAILVAKIEKRDLRYLHAVVKQIVVYALTTASVSAILGVSEAFLLMLFWKKTSAYAAIGLVMPGIASMSVIVTIRARQSLAATIKPPELSTKVIRAFPSMVQPQFTEPPHSGDAETMLMLVNCTSANASTAQRHAQSPAGNSATFLRKASSSAAS